MKNYIKLTVLTACILLFTAGCKKFLDKKPDQALIAPENARDLQGLMDNYSIMNEADAVFGQISSDDVYIPDASYGRLNETFRRMYIWGEDLGEVTLNDWYQLYRTVNYTNIVIENVEKLDRGDGSYQNVLGQAFFHRAWSFYSLASDYTMHFDDEISKNDLGIVLRLKSDFNLQSVRSTNKETYKQIINDAKMAISLLPNRQANVFRPSKAAAYGLLSRIYLSMNNFAQAKLYADSCLSYNFSLLDYNSVNASAVYPFSKLNSEVLFEKVLTHQAPVGSTYLRVPPDLYGLYDNNDLRKALFFTIKAPGQYGYKGSYENNETLFSGIAVDEMLLIRAECQARMSNLVGALQDLNLLLTKRYKSGTFVPITTQSNVLSVVMTERRKELLNRGLRWVDLKRLNALGENITISRNVNSTTYTLEPNSLRYAIQLPPELLQFGLQLNPR